MSSATPGEPVSRSTAPTSTSDGNGPSHAAPPSPATQSGPTAQSGPITQSPQAEPPAADRAYRHVKDGLLDGRFPDGHLLSEGEIAEALSMSRTPVREAFLRLQTEGFLRLYPKRGAFVVPVSPVEARAVVEARMALETFAIDKLAAQGHAAMAGVGHELTEHPACDTSDLTDAQMHEADRAFHAHLVQASGNPVIDDLYNTLRDRQMRLTATARTHTRRPQITQQHGQVARALADGDPERAKTYLREHLLDTVRALGASGGPLLETD